MAAAIVVSGSMRTRKFLGKLMPTHQPGIFGVSMKVRIEVPKTFVVELLDQCVGFFFWIYFVNISCFRSLPALLGFVLCLHPSLDQDLYPKWQMESQHGTLDGVWISWNNSLQLYAILT